MIIISSILIGIIVLVPVSMVHFSIANPLHHNLSLALTQSYAQSSSFWSSGESMPEPREEIAGALLDDKIYIIGGSDDTNKGITKDVDIYDPKSDKWSTGASLPEPRDHIGVASFDGKLYVVGGFNADDIPTNQLLIYDPNIDKWLEGKSMPTARGALIAEFINGTLYAVGGVDSSHNVVSTNEAYDPQTDTWIERQPMPTARHHLASAVVDGKLYAIGGRILGNGVPRPVNEALTNLNDNEVYDPKQNNWTILSPMPTKRSGLAASSVNSEIFVFGGQSLNGTFNSNEKYDTESNIWTTDRPMPTSRLGLEAISFDNKIYVFGGKSDLGKTVGANEVFHPRRD